MHFRFPLVVAFVAIALARPVPGQQSHQVVVVVRHAEKDSVPKDDPPLTRAGVARAHALAATLADADLGAVITTDLRRSRETGRIVAEERKLTTIMVARGADIPAHARAVAAAVRVQHARTVLVVGHGETVGPIIAALGGPEIPQLCADEYSDLFVLILDRGAAPRLIRSLYGEPSAPHRPNCAPMMR